MFDAILHSPPFVSDPSNGYEAIAAELIAERGALTGVGVGVHTVQAWTTTLRPGGAVLDIGCGSGYPVTQLLVQAGLSPYGVDASPTMVAHFRASLPSAPIDCETAERSSFFDRQFDGVIAWGLLFLLSPDAQAVVIGKVASALVAGGGFLFTAPRQLCEWTDNMTGQRSVSLGADGYRRLLESAGLRPSAETDDEGANHYYIARKP